MINPKKIIKMRLMILITTIIISTNITFGQVPASLEKEIDNFYMEMLNAFKILKDDNIKTAVAKVSSMRPTLEKKAEEIDKKLVDLQLSEENILLFGNKILEKPYMKEYMSVIQDQILLDKILNSSEIKSEFDALELILGSIGEDDEKPVQQDDIDLKDVCSFTVDGSVPYKGSYTVKAENNNATAQIDENGIFTVEIRGSSGNIDMTIILMSEKSAVGKYKWTMESQCYIEGVIDENESSILMTSYYLEGYIQLEKVGNTGGEVRGTFSGKFFDDTGSTETPVVVKGNFSAIRIRDVN